MDIVINIQEYIFPNKVVIFREISWIHLKSGIGETVSVFTPDYELSEQEYGIVNRTVKQVHGLRFKIYSNDKGLWISNNDVKEYIKQIHSLYCETFSFKGGIVNEDFFDELEIPSIFLDIPKCVKVLGYGCGMYRCIYYKIGLKKIILNK